LLEDKTANEIAQFLLKLDGKIDKISYYRNQIFTFCPKPSEDLQSALARLSNMLDKVYPVSKVDNLPHRDSILKVAVLSFLPDQLSVPLMSEIQKAATKCQSLSYEQILKLASAAEKQSMLKPTGPLQFGRAIGSSPSPSYMQLNSIFTEAAVFSTMRKRNELTADLSDSYPNYMSPSYSMPPYNPLAQNVLPMVPAQSASQVTPVQQAHQSQLVTPLTVVSRRQYATPAVLSPDSIHDKSTNVMRNYPELDYDDLTPTTAVVQDHYSRHLAIMRTPEGRESNISCSQTYLVRLDHPLTLLPVLFQGKMSRQTYFLTVVRRDKCLHPHQ
jgi:hypothetical protein